VLVLVLAVGEGKPAQARVAAMLGGTMQVAGKSPARSLGDQSSAGVSWTSSNRLLVFTVCLSIGALLIIFVDTWVACELIACDYSLLFCDV